MKKALRLLSLISLVALLLAACTPPAVAPTEAPAPVEGPKATEAPKPTEAAPVEEPVVEAPVAETRPLVVIASDAPCSADPAENWCFGGAAYLPNVYETLFVFVGEENPTLEPLLAAEIPTLENGGISADSLTYTIKLRAEAKFHDGSPVNSDAVMYTFDRMKGLKLGVEGLSANWINTMEKVDETTVKLTLAKPFADFLNALSSVWGAYIVNPVVAKANEANGDFGNEWMKTHDAGSGPYTLASFDDANQVVTLERSLEYWGGWKNATPIDKVIVRWLSDATGARQLIEKGDADIVINLPATDFAALEYAPGFMSYRYPSIMQYYLALNGSVAPLDNVKVRQALQYTFDTDKVISDIFLGDLVKMEAAVGPGYPDVYPAKTQYSFDLEKAKTLLKEAGFENGFELTVNSIGAVPDETAVLEFWQADLAKVGITMKIQQLDWGTFDAAWFKCNIANAANIGQVASLGVGGDYPSAWEVLAQVYANPRLSGDKCSVVFLDTPAVNDTFNEITNTTDPAIRKELFQKLYDAIADDAGAIWMGQGVDRVTMRDVVQGYRFYFSRGGNYLPLADLSLSQ